jgi:hypothetical protein
MGNKAETYATSYFTGTQASIYVGDIWVDEVFGISFSASQSIIPLFGYASTFFDAVAKGKVLIQGYFDINFVDEGYLYAILEAKLRENNPEIVINKDNVGMDQIEMMRQLGPNAQVFSPDEFKANTAAQVIARHITYLKEVSEGTRPNGQDRRQAIGAIMNEISQLDIRQAKELGSELNRKNRTLDKRNIIYEMVPFKLTGYFGNPELTKGKQQGTYKEIVDCFLIGNEMIVDTSEEVVKERYSFLARQHI